MESLFLRPAPFSSLQTPHRPKPSTSHQILFPSRALSLPSALKSPKGFGPPSQTNKPKQKHTKPDEDDDDGYENGAKEDDTIPEVVTNRMMRRMGLSIGIPLGVGLLFFPFFYYLKVVAKIDVPTWIPFIVSFFFFGSALLGVSYGIVSASWDPLREGSLLGWNEARRNWPVFWESLWGRGKK
ncbi:PAM68-like protein [Dioscorea alata]|uniref:PAM68-like protein n=1 Tax=Dioscorea alata TaxID=55571 RepID=A0ACB7UFD6_DIOAL|nr:PAM68-like protein [Dioscorea alata]